MHLLAFSSQVTQICSLCGFERHVKPPRTLGVEKIYESLLRQIRFGGSPDTQGSGMPNSAQNWGLTRKPALSALK
jgi:hypothetical protein